MIEGDSYEKRWIDHLRAGTEPRLCLLEKGGGYMVMMLCWSSSLCVKCCPRVCHSHSCAVARGGSSNTVWVRAVCLYERECVLLVEAE